MRGVIVIWTDDMIEKVKKSFPISYNRELSTRLGVSMRTLIRKARELGIEKEPGFLEIRHQEITEMAIKNHPPQKTKGVKGWSVPGGEKFRFTKGRPSIMKTNRDVVKKATDSRNKTIRREKLRLKYGLSQLTRLNIKNYY